VSFSQAWGTIPMRMGWAGMWVGSVQQGRGMVGMYTISRRHYGFRHVVCIHIETRHYLGFMEATVSSHAAETQTCKTGSRIS